MPYFKLQSPLKSDPIYSMHHGRREWEEKPRAARFLNPTSPQKLSCDVTGFKNLSTCQLVTERDRFFADNLKEHTISPFSRTSCALPRGSAVVLRTTDAPQPGVRSCTRDAPQHLTSGRWARAEARREVKASPPQAPVEAGVRTQRAHSERRVRVLAGTSMRMYALSGHTRYILGCCVPIKPKAH